MSLDQYYTLGRSGLRVSRLALGTMTFGTEWGWGSDESTARAIFDRYLDAGGNFIDTADGYTGGTSERMVGRFVREGGTRDRVVITTKFTFNGGAADAKPNPNAGGNHRKNLMRAVEGSLSRLGTDYIDLYLMHAWDQVTPAEEVMRGYDDLVSAGKVRYVGFSDVPAWYAARAQTLAEWRGWEPCVALQLEYSLVERNIEREFTRLATELGFGIMVWSPLASGLLTGKYARNRDDTQGQGRLAQMKDTNHPAFQKFTDRNWKIASVLEGAAKRIGCTPAQLALQWAASRPGVASVIVGATSLAQLDDNLGALDVLVPDEVRTELDVASAPERQFPYFFFEPLVQGRIHGGATVGDKPRGYRSDVLVSGGGASVQR